MRLIFSNISFYNKQILNIKLQLKNRSYTLKELLSLSYEKWENNLFSHLDGDYAFAFYKADENSYFAARDPMGIKSLYYTRNKDRYIYASSINELLVLSNIEKRPNIKSMQTMLCTRTLDYSETMYEGIYRVPPGYYLTIKDDKKKLVRYWFPEKIQKDYKITKKEASEKLKLLLSQAIDKRVERLEDTAFQVSGGLDSSSVVSLLAQHKNSSKIESYSMSFKGLASDESTYVDSILELYSLKHSKVSCEKLDYNEKYSLSKLYSISADWPMRFSSPMAFAMIEKMKEKDKKVILTGQGGDELFGRNYYVFYDWFRNFQFSTLYRELSYFSKPCIAVKRYIIKPLLGEDNILYLKKILGRDSSNNFFNSKDKIIDFSEKIGISDLAFKNNIDAISSAQHNAVLDGNSLHPAEQYFNVEFRHPFYDLDLVEFALSLPSEFSYSEGKSKWLFRKAMEGILPEKINNRKDKAEFSEIVAQQIEAIDVHALLDNPYIVKLGLIDQAGVNKIVKEYEKQTIKKPFQIWGLINMEYWYRFNFEKESLPA